MYIINLHFSSSFPEKAPSVIIQDPSTLIKNDISKSTPLKFAYESGDEVRSVCKLIARGVREEMDMIEDFVKNFN